MKRFIFVQDSFTPRPTGQIPTSTATWLDEAFYFRSGLIPPRPTRPCPGGVIAGYKVVVGFIFIHVTVGDITRDGVGLCAQQEKS